MATRHFSDGDTVKVNTTGQELQIVEALPMGRDVIYRCRVEETGAIRLYDSRELRPATRRSE